MIRGSLSLCLATLLPLTAATAQGMRDRTRICLAPASVEGAVGSAADAMTAVRETFTSFLTGPSLEVTPLSARLESQAREEAKAATCPYLLLVRLKHVRKSGGGLLRRMAGSAVQEGAWSAGAAATTTAGRVASSAAAGAAGAAAYDFASSIKTKDELTLTYHLEAASGTVLVEGSEERKAKSDGEDLLTPLVEHAARAVVAAAAKGRR